ncbi:PREDICTED: uncharacterized protein LOC109583130 [Amphimedon queenslandica]|uniref:EF-hand domain-containing protein n=1 Tax=Amphimedon queenslandica TaxID=400682 RepID=A0A1X7UJK6_AMPQE|nr:PREDICTED: uncharacterized protein LOC109583130 [Amphimedon queenslandica]|eukprot:XP_019853889.1 PREDICTED: uncharacterized protein LOC109583130 [Amphimedon queenslandica]
MALDLRKRFDEADKEKSGFIKHKGLQVILKGSTACDASMARKAVAIIVKNGKISFDELQGICKGKPGASAPPSPRIDVKLLTFTIPTSLSGTWTNELGSQMVISTSSYAEGQMNGIYNSKVGDAYEYYWFYGMYDTDGDETAGTLGWTVQWDNTSNGNSQSNTAWSGQRYEISGTYYIYSTWILVSQTSSDDNWESTLVGQDKFSKYIS